MMEKWLQLSCDFDGCQEIEWSEANETAAEFRLRTPRWFRGVANDLCPRHAGGGAQARPPKPMSPKKAQKMARIAIQALDAATAELKKVASEYVIDEGVARLREPNGEGDA